MTRDILDQIDHVLDDDGTSVDAMRWTPEVAPEPPTPPNPAAALQRFATVAIEVNLEPFLAAMRNAAQQVGAIMRRHKRTFHLVAVAQLPPRDRRRHLARCDQCNPRANPAPLPRAARGYHQRLRSRRRRGVKRGRR
jgi:hypothetical protein